ncbi:MAG: T9SS type A sorting domain-containing protein [Bacteroidetes bacterium]|nr:T9SS type A sorting domain-containing protein [Bacteroidota bacterium]
MKCIKLMLSLVFVVILTIGGKGQEIITRQIQDPKTEIDISNLPAGIYIVKVWNDKNVMVQKVIKE